MKVRCVGLVLGGPGKVWLDDARVEIVGPEVAVTRAAVDNVVFNPPLRVDEMPRNLDFEE